MDIKLQTQALQLKSILNKINDISYSYAQISREHPFSRIQTNEQLKLITASYEILINDLVNYLHSTGYEKREEAKKP